MNVELIRQHAALIGSAATAILAHIDSKGPAAVAEDLWANLKATHASLQALADHLRPEVIAGRQANQPQSPSAASSGDAGAQQNTPQPAPPPAGGNALPPPPTLIDQTRTEPRAAPQSSPPEFERLTNAPVLRPGQQVATAAHINDLEARLQGTVRRVLDHIPVAVSRAVELHQKPFNIWPLVSLALGACLFTYVLLHHGYIEFPKFHH